MLLLNYFCDSVVFVCMYQNLHATLSAIIIVLDSFWVITSPPPPPPPPHTHRSAPNWSYQKQSVCVQIQRGNELLLITKVC